MPYVIKNLIGSKGAPNSRKCRTDEVLKSAYACLRIGRQNVKRGKSLLITDNAYSSNKEMLDHLAGIGAIAVEPQGVKAPVKESKKPAPAPKKVEVKKPEPKKVEPAKEEDKKDEEPCKPDCEPECVEECPAQEAAKPEEEPAKAPVKKAPVAKAPVKKAPAKKTPSPKEAAKKRAAAAKASKESK